MARDRVTQLFSEDYLDRCRSMEPGEILEFLETFRQLQERKHPSSRLISMKIPEDLLRAFRMKCEMEGVRYQTRIKRLMRDWLSGQRH